MPAAGSVGLVGPADAETPTWDTDRVWTLPNVLSLLRLAGVPLMVWLILGPHHDLLAVAVLALAGFTDWLDGFLARRWHQTSRVGQMLDPVADRLYILAVVLCLAVRDVIPWWLVVLLVARDAMITALVPLLRTRGFSSLPVHFLGKAATFNLLYAFPLILLGADDGLGWTAAGVLGWAFALWGVGLYWWAGLLYLAQTLRLLRDVPRRTRTG
ncbi:CDP-alcohol phosphatidyltransferase family protein [Microlunatus capsulatus]|uniref:CDP-alcohol phosphatidyltransferase family protein n=1 Tax=Microlunatus capsulatus TaxID=99117 RepID=UPI001FD93986|nr:CDP-alcohol phosphatidyltransferase family protein [Microlunatus capsulatus]